MDIPESREVTQERLQRAAIDLLTRAAQSVQPARASPWLYLACLAVPYLFGAMSAVVLLYCVGALR